MNLLWPWLLNDIQSIKIKAEDLRKEVGANLSPVNLDYILRYLKIDLKVESFKRFPFTKELKKKYSKIISTITIDSLLDSLVVLYLRDENTIYANLDSEKLKRRWGIAHDIGHHIFKHYSNGFILDRELDFLPKPDYSVSFQAKEEFEANYFASCLLYPEKEWNQFKDQTPFNIKSAQKLAERFETTLWSVINQLVITSNKIVCLLIFPYQNFAKMSYRDALYSAISHPWYLSINETETSNFLTGILHYKALKILPKNILLPTKDGKVVILSIKIIYTSYQQFIIYSE